MSAMSEPGRWRRPCGAAADRPPARPRGLRLGAERSRARARPRRAVHRRRPGPRPEAGNREERRYRRLLLIMVAVIVVGGFVLGIIANIIGAAGRDVTPGPLPSAAHRRRGLGDAPATSSSRPSATLIRIPSINPPPADAGDGELRRRELDRRALARRGVRAEVHEPVPGRGSVTARLRGDGTGGEPLLLLATSTSCPRRRSAGPTTRSPATSPTATSGAAARST